MNLRGIVYWYIRYIDKARAPLVQERTELQHANNHFIETLKKDYEKMRAELEARHAGELKELKEKLDVEKLVCII